MTEESKFLWADPIQFEAPIQEIIERYKGQDVFVAIEVLTYDEKTCEPLTGRLIGTTPDREEASKLIQGHKCAMVNWTGKRAEVIILYADISV